MKSQREGDKLTIFAEGRIDTIRAPQFADGIEQVLDDGVKDVTLDFSRVAYISSTGLRVLMQAVREMRKRRGEIRITNVNEDVYAVLETTGFIGACDVELKQ